MFIQAIARRFAGIALGVMVSAATVQADDTEPVAGKYAEAAAAPTAFNIEPLTCWDVTTLEETEAAYAFVLLFGYLSGKSGEDHVSPAEIESTIKKTAESCEKNPDAVVLDVMAKARG